MTDMTDSGIVRIYTDGACSGNPGPGGWGAVIFADGVCRELSGGFRKTTNNRMEIYSVIAALEALSADAESVEVISDSRYVVDMITAGHVEKWRRNNWMKDKRHSAQNVDLWERLLELCCERDISFTWVRGHEETPENHRADELAVAARQAEDLAADDGYENPPLFVGDSLFG